MEKQRTIQGNVKKRSLVWPSLVNITQKSLDIAIIKSIHEGGFDKYILFSLKARVEFNGREVLDDKNTHYYSWFATTVGFYESIVVCDLPLRYLTSVYGRYESVCFFGTCLAMNPLLFYP